jgi:hypothetical protein
MKIPVQDANVLINLELTGLFDLWFQTGHRNPHHGFDPD